MNRRIIWGFTLCILLVIGFAAGRADSAGNEAPSGIAVVSIPEVIDGSSYATSLDEGLNAKKDKVLAELDKYKAQIDALRADLNTRKQGSTEYNDLAQQIIEKSAIAEAKKDYMQKSLLAENKDIMEKLYIDILAAVKEVCEEKNIEMALDRDEVKLPAANSTELSGVIQTHKVLYHAPNLDITKDVITKLDKSKKQ
ncbi:MAG: OmpH family outer membrane protein [Phycisphaerae bacterium]